MQGGGRLRDLRVAPGYVAAVAATAGVLHGTLTPAARDAVVRACSTNVHNLSQDRWSVLGTSMLVPDHRPSAAELTVLLAVLGTGELVLGPDGLLLVMTAGHCGASLLVYAGLRVGIARGWYGSGLLDPCDVGTSYAALAVAAALVRTLPAPVRGALLVALGGLVGAPLAGHPSFTDVGHLLAALTGLAAGALLSPGRGGASPPSPWTRSGRPAQRCSGRPRG